MLDVTKIEEAIDAFTLSDPEETYNFTISPRNTDRKYLGMSALGDDCVRKLQFDFRKCSEDPRPARMMRLWRRGDREEYVFMFLLRGIGFNVFGEDENGKQFKVSDFEGHLSGHFDGGATAPKKFWKKGCKPHPFLTEYKTYNDTRFKELTKKGVKRSDPKYYGQMITYMGYEGFKGALFCAVNKNDDRLYFEWVPFNKNEFDNYVHRAEDILTSVDLLDRISNTASFWKCKFCCHSGVCHHGKPSIKSCRSCKFGEPAENATWKCAKGREFGTVCKEYRDFAKR